MRVRCLFTATHRLKHRILTGSRKKVPSFQTQSLLHPSARRIVPCYSPDGTRRRPDTSSISSELDTTKSDSGTFSTETATGQHGSANGISTPVSFQRSATRLTFLKTRRLGFSTGPAITSIPTISRHRNLDKDWRNERWDGYETDALNRYAFQFMDDVDNDTSFCLFVSPHQAHSTPYKFAPDEYYDRLPAELQLPENVPDSVREQSLNIYRHYLAMVLTVDDMLGELMAYLERTGRVENTLLVFGSDHGTHGVQGINFWGETRPYGIHQKCIGYAAPGVFDEIIAPAIRSHHPWICSHRFVGYAVSNHRELSKVTTSPHLGAAKPPPLSKMLSSR